MTISTIRVPDVGEGVAEVEIVTWHVKPGDHVREDDLLADVMTDKATVEIPSLFAGTVVELGGAVGETLAVGGVLCRIEHAGTDASPETEPAKVIAEEPVKAVAEPVAAAASPKTAPVVAKSAASEAPAIRQTQVGSARAPRPEGAAPLASPAVRDRARRAGIDLRAVAGSGPAGRITDADLDAVFAAPPPSPAGETRRARKEGTERIPVIGLRRKIADRMALANARIPHITVVEEVDVSALEDLRAAMNERRGDKPKLTLLPFLAAALKRAFVDHPEMNAHYLDDDGVVERHNAIHLGIATMTPNGLVVPVLRHAEALGLFGAAGEIARLAEAARHGKATREELSGSTFTITSLGPLGAIATTPIINHPEVAILGVNRMAIRPMWDGSQFVPRRMMNISASFDHRVIDGWNAASFVQRLRGLLEAPALIFMEDEA
ncbi:dihydrolipoamide acetyltransferase family protein [Rhizobium sp. C4]|uniref:dihydrolipoamide acetyltransferase family protein n=1 Tax=Rhizobium sp. C4 TaxID=1349800 RepID=UPI001E28FE0C|nr:dihydrolipoamide acetyltransferase family protein [Rhizobium sp. C4]MCD2172078.1 2-oxo acid dehydrogenase subunit E2 [Rhizobium sp. C4]